MHAKGPERLPVVMTRDEVDAVLGHLRGVPRLMGILLYGAGLRLRECAELRVKDVDFGSNQILVAREKAGRTASPCSPRREGPTWAAIWRPYTCSTRRMGCAGPAG